MADLVLGFDSAEKASELTPKDTIVVFDRPIPLIRGPLMAGEDDDPSKGSFVLAFRDAPAWRRSFRSSEAKIREECEVGARIGCSLSASDKCNPPWWKTWFGLRLKSINLAEKAQCEERETEACLVSAREACVLLAHEKCLHAYGDARVAILSPGRDSKATSYKGKCLLACRTGKCTESTENVNKTEVAKD